MKVIIAGGRDFNDYEYLCEIMSTLESEVTEVVCGGARGADSLGAKWAKEKDISVAHFPADWESFGKSAGYRRNLDMQQYGDYLVAFWDEKSKGTKHMIDIMAKHKPGNTMIVLYDEKSSA